MIINKYDVEKALSAMELKLLGRTNEDNPNLPPVLRIMNVFTEAYFQNYYPEESVLLRESYRLLKEKGYYYTEM